MTRVNITDGSVLKTDDTEPNLQAELVKNNGVPQTLNNYDVSFKMREANSTELVVDTSTTETPQLLTIDDPDLGRVVYDWQPEDTATSGTYEAELEIDDGNGSVLTFPNQGFFTVQIEEGL